MRAVTPVLSIGSYSYDHRPSQSPRPALFGTARSKEASPAPTPKEGKRTGHVPLSI